MRQYMRHPADIPIVLEKNRERPTLTVVQESDPRIQNISSGGVCCITSCPYPVGEKVKVIIGLVKSDFQAVAEVMWCQSLTIGYEIGLCFLSLEDAYAARMVEQICHIEHYKREVYINEGRLLSSEEAAQEWIEKYAMEFPGTQIREEEL